MAYRKFKKGGQGGKKGHSNMAHSDYTETIKREYKRVERHKAKQELKMIAKCTKLK